MNKNENNTNRKSIFRLNLFFLLSLCLSMLLLSLIGNAQVKFEQTKNFYQLLNKAKKEQKPLFIDGYTDWCGWCKELDRKVFCTGAVADTMNAHFIAAKFEMEKDSFGVLLARKYGINGFPTAIVLTPEGELISVLFGYAPPKDYLNMIREVSELVKKGQTITGYSTLLEMDFPPFYNNVFPFNGEKTFPDSTTVNTYLANRKSLTDEVSWNIINRFSFLIDSENESHILSSIDSLTYLFGRQNVESFLNNFIGSKMYNAVKSNNSIAYSLSVNQAKQYLSSPGSLLFAYQLEWFKKQNDWTGYALAIEHGLKDPSLSISTDMINQYCWDIYTDCENTAVIKTAVDLMKNRVLTENDAYAFHDTYACLIYKSGDLKKAQAEAIKAIEIGKKNKEDVSSTKELLEKINTSLASKK